MKNYLKNRLVKLPRSFRILWGKTFMYMLGKMGTHEFYNDINLYNELNLWVKTGGRPNKY